MVECPKSPLLERSREIASEEHMAKAMLDPHWRLEPIGWRGASGLSDPDDLFSNVHGSYFEWTVSSEAAQDPPIDTEFVLPAEIVGWPEVTFRAMQDALKHVAVELGREVTNAANQVVSGMTAVVVAYAEEGISRLKLAYEFRDCHVRQCLLGNPSLISVLNEIANEVPTYFGPEVQLALEVLHDPEDDHEGELFAVIQTSIQPDVALDRLRAFDQDWWLDRSQRIAGSLTVTLE